MIPAPPPSWLPKLVPFRGDWNSFVRALYSLFSIDFKSGQLRFRGRPVWYDRQVLPGDPNRYEEGFWHLVTRDNFVWDKSKRCMTKQRLPDIERAQHLPWGKPTVEHAMEAEVLVWNFDETTKRGNAVRTYLWLRNWHYAVILEEMGKKKGNIFMLITTFLVDAPGKRADLESRYARRKR